MAAVELVQIDGDKEFDALPYLRLVELAPASREFRHGANLRFRRARRARVLQRRRRALAGLAILSALAVLALPGHTWGATTGAGLSTDLADSSVLASGMVYVVQPGDTVNSIARDVNPVDPSRARRLLVHELDSSVVVPGEHVLIP